MQQVRDGQQDRCRIVQDHCGQKDVIETVDDLFALGKPLPNHWRSGIGQDTARPQRGSGVSSGL